MNDLIQQIQAAQIRAGEEAVISHLREQGLASGAHVPPQIAEDDVHGLALDSGEFIPASELNVKHMHAEIVPAEPPIPAIAVAGNLLVDVCHGAAKTAGWWKNSGADLTSICRNGSLLGKALVSQKLCLIHSEVSEAMEGHRKGLMDDKLPHRPMIEVELADAIIRIADLAGALKLDLGGAIAEKMEFNAVRPDHKAEVRAAAGGKSY